MRGGYHGRVLRVNLSSRTWEAQEIPDELLRDFIGGVGLGTRLLYEYAPAGVDPLSPENPLIFATTPLVGTLVTTSAKHAVVAKSPLTGFIGDSLSGSHLAVELQRTGGDAPVITGASPALA